MSFISKSIKGRQFLLNKSITYFWVIYRIVKFQIYLSSRGFTVLLTTEVVPKIFSNLNVVCHLGVPAGWGSCLPRMAIFFDKLSDSKVADLLHIG